MAGKLIQVATTTITPATKTASLELTGINTDDVYLFAFNNLNVEADVTMFMRFTEGGVVNSTANYDYARKQLNSGGAFANVSGANQTAVNMQVVTDTTCYGNGLIYLYNFNNSSEYSFCSFDFGYANTGYSDTTGSSGGAVFTSASSCDGIAFVTGAGYEINSGTFTLYKVV